MQPGNIIRHDEKLLRYALAAGVVLALICAYYFEENWRGHHAWKHLKHQLEAGGASVDWTNYIPASVPDDQNVFGEPKMQRWFVGRGGCDLSSRLNSARENFLEDHDGGAMARVTVVKRGTKLAPDAADIILNYDSVLSCLSLATEEASGTNPAADEVCPVIALRDIPVKDAIKNLARAAGVKYALDPRLSQFQPTVSLVATNETARKVLASILKAYHLRYIPNSKTGSGHIIIRDSSVPDVGFEPAAKEKMEKLLTQTVESMTNELYGNCAYSSLGITLAGEAPPPVKPLRVVVMADEMPGSNVVAAFFPPVSIGVYGCIKSSVLVAVTGSNSCNVSFNAPPCVSAADYLKWTDSFAPDFDFIRETLKRPFAQMKGDYRNPPSIPIPNFVCQRIVAQSLADRAKCHLLVGQPEEALKDLTLVRGLCRIMEGSPDKRPLTLVATMIDSAVTGLYADTIAEGMRLHAWREPELAALQEQLKEINLPPLLAQSFQFERAASCHTLENVKPDDFVKLFNTGTPKGFWDKMKDPTYMMMEFAPRGWVYQNMVKIAAMDGKYLEGFDVTNRRVSSAKIEKAVDNAMASLSHFRPYNYLALVMVPNFSRAVQTLSRNQCMAEEALTACALERYRLAHGKYPETLAALVPQLLEKVPPDIINGEPLKYRLKENDQFVLYSVGWNGKDDGGVPGPKKDGASDVRLGDWVWADVNR
jgi:hypothetical protein